MVESKRKNTSMAEELMENRGKGKRRRRGFDGIKDNLDLMTIPPSIFS